MRAANSVQHQLFSVSRKPRDAVGHTSRPNDLISLKKQEDLALGHQPNGAFVFDAE